MKHRLFTVFLSLTLLAGLPPVAAAAAGFQAEQEITGSSSETPDPVQGFSAEESLSNGFAAEPSQDILSGEFLSDDPENSTDVLYLEYNAASGKLETQTASAAVTLISDTNTWGENGNNTWYVAPLQGLSIDKEITIQGNVHLILPNGCTLSTWNITFEEGSSLTIYGQSEDEDTMGKLDVMVPWSSGSSYPSALIGSESVPANLIIHSGGVSATSLNESSDALYGSLTIYGGCFETGNTTRFGIHIPETGAVNVLGGTISIQNGTSGIYIDGGSLNVSGGSVTVRSNNTGISSSNKKNTITVSGGTIDVAGNTGIQIFGTFTILDGTVTASGYSGSGINSSECIFTIYNGTVSASGNHAGITNSRNSTFTIYNGTISASGYFVGIENSGTFIIRNGTVSASADKNYEYSNGISNSGNFTISGGLITATGGQSVYSPYEPISVSNAIFIATGKWSDFDNVTCSNCIIIQDGVGTVYNDYTLSKDLSLENGTSLTIPGNASLTIGEGITLTVDGDLTIEEQGTMSLQKNSTLIVKGKFTNNGTIIQHDGSILSDPDKGSGTTLPAVSSISLNRTSLSLTPGSSFSLTASIFPENATGQKLVWTSSDPSVASLSVSDETTGNNSTAIVTAGQTGTAIVTIATEDDQCSATCTVTVSNPYYPVTGITLDQISLSLEKGNTAVLHATVTPSYATAPTVTWSSSNNAVATVDTAGQVTAAGGGTAVITARAGSYSAACTVTVTVPATGLTLDQTSLNLFVGGQTSLTASLSPEDATRQQILWSSSDPSVVTVTAESADTENSAGENDNGNTQATVVLTAVGKGTAVITASTADGAFSASCTVTVPGTPSATALSVSGRTTSSVTLSWDAVEEAEGYTIWYRSEYETSVTRKIIWDGDTTSWTKTGLKPGTKYFFAIRSWVTDADGNYVFSEVSPTQRGTTKPKAAVIQSVTVTNGHVKVRLAGKAEGARRYSICYADSRNGFAENNFQVGIRTSYTVRTITPKLEPGTYYISVKSYRDLGNHKRVYGDWSNLVKVTVS